MTAPDAVPARVASGGDSRHTETVYGYGDEQTRAEALEWLRKKVSRARPANLASARSETYDYGVGVWRHIIDQLTGGDLEQSRLIITAVSIGTEVERAQASYDLRRAIAVHGPTGVAPYLREMATLLLDHPGQQRRAGMLACLAESIEPDLMSDQYRNMQRRYWGLDTDTHPAPPPGPHHRRRTRSRR